MNSCSICLKQNKNLIDFYCVHGCGNKVYQCLVCFRKMSDIDFKMECNTKECNKHIIMDCLHQQNYEIQRKNLSKVMKSGECQRCGDTDIMVFIDVVNCEHCFKMFNRCPDCCKKSKWLKYILCDDCCDCESYCGDLECFNI